MVIPITLSRFIRIIPEFAGNVCHELQQRTGTRCRSIEVGTRTCCSVMQRRRCPTRLPTIHPVMHVGSADIRIILFTAREILIDAKAWTESYGTKSTVHEFFAATTELHQVQDSSASVVPVRYQCSEAFARMLMRRSSTA